MLVIAVLGAFANFGCVAEDETSPTISGTFELERKIEYEVTNELEDSPFSHVFYFYQTLTLSGYGDFTFIVDPFISFVPMGRYSVEGNALTLLSIDNEVLYTFYIEGYELVYVADEFREIPIFYRAVPPLENGDRFVLRR
jgi:hypothetical protein